MRVEIVAPTGLEVPAETVIPTVECLLHKYYCNWQQVTVLSRNGLQGPNVSCFRFAFVCPPKMFPCYRCYRLIFDQEIRSRIVAVLCKTHEKKCFKMVRFTPTWSDLVRFSAINLDLFSHMAGSFFLVGIPGSAGVPPDTSWSESAARDTPHSDRDSRDPPDNIAAKGGKRRSCTQR